MQVLPTIDSVIQTYDLYSHSASASSAFSDMFNQAQGSVTQQLDTTVQMSRIQAVQQPDELIGSKDMRLGTQELNQLRETLRSKGVSDQSLEQINDLLASGQMPTLGQLFNTLRSGGTPIELTDTDKKNIQSALQKMGFNPDEAEYLKGVMESGNGKSIWKAISQRINSMGADGESSDFFQDEMASLIKGMGGSGKLVNALDNFFKGNEGLNLGAVGLKAALSGLAEEVAQKLADQGKIAKNIQAAMLEAAEGIKERQGKEALSDKRNSRDVERSEFLMKDKAMAKANGLSDAPAKGGTQDGKPESDQQGLLQKNKNETLEKELDDKAATAKSKKAEASGEQAKGQTKSKTADTAKNETASEIFSKIEAAPSALHNLGSQSNTASAATMLNNMSKSAEGMRQSAFHEAIFSQVEQGLFQKLNNGASQLVLRLDPVDLGQVTLLVAVNQGEVRATMRADNNEAAQALHEQLPRIQALLENQGFKVQKLDVQAQVQDNSQQGQPNSNNWESLAQHNTSQERHEEAMRQLFNRGGLGKNALAQDMHNTSGDMLSAAEISRIVHNSSSMYVVA